MEDELIKLGFTHSGDPGSLIGDNYRLIYKSKHGKTRCISISNYRNPCEMVMIQEIDPKDSRKVEDQVCVSNFDYDGYMSLERIKALVFSVTNDKFLEYKNYPIRLYLVDRVTEKCTGKKRDYASLDLFKKYGKEAYERYNREFYYTDEPTGLKAKVCFLLKNKWNKLPDEILKSILNE